MRRYEIVALGLGILDGSAPYNLQNRLIIPSSLNFAQKKGLFPQPEVQGASLSCSTFKLCVKNE